MEGYFKFTDRKTKYVGHILRQSGNVISLAFDDTVPKAETVSGRGATWYTNGGIALGDYENFTTVYRWVDGCYQLSCDGSVYEDAPEPEPYAPTETELRIAELNAIIEQNKALLTESDYRVIKNAEYTEAGKDAEYEPVELNSERQALRDAINAAEAELAEITI